MKTEDTLTRARDLITGDRAKQHGPKHINHENIARYWSAYLHGKGNLDITASDVAGMMALLKIARTHAGGFNEDDFVDAAAYSAIMGELLDPDEQPKIFAVLKRVEMPAIPSADDTGAG